MLTMTPRLTHFAINTSDVGGTQAFYGTVFGWEFREYGAGFVQIMDANGEAPMGAIQERRDLLDGEPTRGLECTFGVENIEATRARIVSAGGKILMDTALVMQYDSADE